MNLSEYRSQNGITQKAMADLIGVGQAAISKYERGEKLPSARIAFKIERETDGHVAAASWFTDDESAA